MGIDMGADVTGLGSVRSHRVYDPIKIENNYLKILNYLLGKSCVGQKIINKLEEMIK